MSRNFIDLLFIIPMLAASTCAATGTLNTGNGENSIKPLSAEVLWKMQRVSTPVISPDGKWVVAPVSRYTMDDDKSHTDLWIFSADGSVERPLTRHGSADGQPAFNPDGSLLAFMSRRDDDEASQIYILPLNEPGEAVRLVTVPTGVNAPKWVTRCSC